MMAKQIAVLVKCEQMYVEPLTKSAAIKCVANKITSFQPILSSKSCSAREIFFLLKMLQDWRNMNWLKYVWRV